MIAYLDCFSGISGDMLLGAMVDAGLPLEELREDLARLPLSGYQVEAERAARGALTGTRVRVEISEGHVHRGLGDVLEIVGEAGLPGEVYESVEATFRRLAEAEAKVHGTTPEEVHFHEVGAVDAIVDIVGAFSGLRRLGVVEVYASPLPLGGGWVEAAHGRIPVPAPATVALLEDVPSYGGPVEAELVTPTGAAIVTTAARGFGPMPAMRMQSVGWGAGARELDEQPNLLRLFIGERKRTARTQQLALLETNLDNMNPELFGHVMDRLFDAGALDVFYTPIVMKKSRPATLVSVLADPTLVDSLSEILFRETTTLGVRVKEIERRCLEREWREVETEYGVVRMKIGRLAEEAVNAAPEYEDCVRLARERGVSAKLVYEAAQEALRQG